MLVTLRGYSVKFVNCLHLTANFWLFSGSRLTLLRPSVNVFFFSFSVKIFLSSRLLERYLEFFNCLRYTLVALYRRQVNSCVLIYGAFLYPKEWERYQLFLESYNSFGQFSVPSSVGASSTSLTLPFSPHFLKNRTNLDRRKFGVITSKKTS